MKNKPSFDLKQLKGISFYLIAGAVICLEVIGALLFFPAQIGQLRQTQASLGDLEREVSSMEDAAKIIKDNQPNVTEENLKKAMAALPNEKKTSGIVSGIANLASEHGVAVKTLEFSPGLISTASAITGYRPISPSGEVDVGGGVKSIPAFLTVEANLSQIESFLKAVYASSQILGVTMISHSVTPQGLESAKIGLLIYYMPLKEGPLNWKNVKPLGQTDLKLLQTLPEQDLYTIPSE